MFHYRYMWRRVRAGSFAARDGGKSFDMALNHRYTTAREAAPDATVVAEMEQLIDDGFADLDLPIEEYRTAALYKDVLREYNKAFQREPFEVLGVQVPIAVPLGIVSMQMPVDATHFTPWIKSINVILQGHLDMLVREDDLVYICDTKTMNQWDNRKLIEWENASQPKAYAWGIQELARLHPDLGLPSKVQGFLLNAIVIRKPSDSSRVKLSRIEFKRPKFNYTPERLALWRKDALAWIEMALSWVTNDHYPQNEKHCAMHYGKPCQYLDVCCAPASQHEMILGMDLFRDYDKGPLDNKTEIPA